MSSAAAAAGVGSAADAAGDEEEAAPLTPRRRALVAAALAPADVSCVYLEVQEKKKKLWHFMFCVLRRLWECWVV